MTENKPVSYVEMSDGAYLYTEYYKAKSNSDGEPEKDEPDVVVFIPGFCCTAGFFGKNVPEISTCYDVIVYDPRGQGNSSKGLQGHTVSRNALDLHEILEYYEKKHAVLVAWSMAGQFAMDYIRQFGTERISGIVMADCPLHALGDEEWNAHGLGGFNMDHFNAHLKLSYRQWEEYCHGFAVKIWGGIDDSRIEWATGEFTKTPPWIAFAIYSDMVYRNGYPRLARTRVPMLFTGADSLVTSNGKDLASRWYPDARPDGLVSDHCTFDRGGHVFFYMEADKFNKCLLEFIDSRIRKGKKPAQRLESES